MQIELGEDEANVLRRMLSGYLRELNYEIADTDTSTFRDQLRGDREVLRTLLERLGGEVS